MTDVERFFRRLVSNLAATDPARLHQPVSLDDISRDILPYRANRRALQLDTSEDYEMVLLRLCAGEGSLVRTEPEAARARFAQEVQSPNPDLHVLYSFENVQVTFRAEQLEWALAPAPRAGPAGPDRQDELEPEAGLVLGAAQFDELPGMREAELPGMREAELPAMREAELPGVEALRDFAETGEPDEPDELDAPDIDQLPDAGETPLEDARPTCIYCGGSLPTHRPVNFCPHCGQSQTQILCPECRTEVEPGWRHCVNCGAAVGEG